MTDVVNLNQFRKKRLRADKERESADNRVKHGRTRAEKDAAKKQDSAERKDLDGKQLNSPDES